MRYKKLRSLGLLGVLLCLWAGCAVKPSAPTQFYLLSPIEGSDIKLKFAERDQYLIVGIGPIELPAYLDRPQFIIREGENRFHLAEFDRWAEPLQNNFERVLLENFNMLLNNEPVAVVRWGGSLSIDYQVQITVLRFESDSEGQVSLDAGWAIMGDDGRKIILLKVSSYKEKSKSAEYKDFVAAQSRVVGALCREITEVIKNLKR